MLRAALVGLVYLFGIVLGLQSVLWAGSLWLWNDIFRPVYWARHASYLGSGWFKPVHLCTGVLIFAVFFTKWPRRGNAAAKAIGLLVVWVWITYFFAQIRDAAWEQAVEATKYLIPLIPISMALCYRRAQEIFLYVMAGSVGIWLVHHGVITVASGHSQIDMAIPGGQMTDRNDFLVAGNACLAMMVYMGWHYRGPFQTFVRWGTRLGSAFAVGAVFYSLSRGALVGLVLLGIWWSFATGRPAKKLALGLVLALAMLPLVPQETWERLQTIQIQGPQTEASAAHRSEHMATAVQVTFDYPIFGVGPDCFPDFSLNYGQFNAEPHSLWLKCSSEYGLPAFVFFVLLILRLLGGLYRAGKEARLAGDRETEALATALSCALVGFLATGSFTSQFLSQYLWSIIALSGAFLARPYWMTAEEAMAAMARKVPTAGTAASEPLAAPSGTAPA